MKPTNMKEPGCNYTTSNCVVWQGPDIDCIDLCKGDTVSEVVYKLATELCTVLDILKVENYDLSCFGFSQSKPTDFEQLVQLILDRICVLQGGFTTVTPIGDPIPVAIPGDAGSARGSSGSGCPDCVVEIAKCFYYTNELGDTVTTMQLLDYARAMGNKICSNVASILSLQQIVTNHETRIVALETAPPPTITLPTVTPFCVLPGVPTQMNAVLQALEQQFCELRTATGNPPALYSNIAKEPSGLSSELSLSVSGATMGSLPGWTPVVTNLAQTLGNMWITIADMRLAVRNILLNCCPGGCEGIELTLVANMTGTVLTIYVSGTVPSGFVQCYGTTTVSVKDSNGNSMTFPYDLLAYLNNPSGYSIDLGPTVINTSLDLDIEMTPCLTNPSTNATCQSCLEYMIYQTGPCPNVTYTQGSNSISYSFTSAVGNYTYTVEVWDSAGVTMIANQTQAISGVQSVTGEILGLSPATVYKVRVTVIPTACPECQPSVCEFTNVTTNILACPPPYGVSASISIDVIL